MLKIVICSGFSFLVRIPKIDDRSQFFSSILHFENSCIHFLLGSIIRLVNCPSQDAFREAKANGFGVTVIRKGEIQLNVDQTLEEVEEQITEIGSKIYHDAIMRDRSVDISTLMKGVFGVTGKKPKKRYFLIIVQLTLFSLHRQISMKKTMLELSDR